jgi:heme/copper-type cytochrome/quinol oxidase subunit 2
MRGRKKSICLARAVGRRAFLLAGVLAATRGLAQIVSSSQVVEVTILKGKKVEGPDVIKLKKGDKVLLLVHSDSADELHIHGYDITAEIVPDQAVRVHFIATRTGRFSFEIHRWELHLGVIEVYPR